MTGGEFRCFSQAEGRQSKAASLASLTATIRSWWYERLRETVMELRELGWLCLVALFLASVLIVLGWLLQYSLTFLRLRRARAAARQVGGDHTSHQGISKAALGFLLKFWTGRHGAAAHEAGVKGLLTSMFSFKSVREHWQRTWVNALNEQACRHGVS